MNQIIRFWFGPVKDDADFESEEVKASLARWFAKDPAFDAEIRTTFGDQLLACARREKDHWLKSVEGRLAQVLLFDQFARNIYRDTPLSFALDRRARNITLVAVDDGSDQVLPLVHRAFLYMPLMHAEKIRHHRLAQDLYQGLLDEAEKKALPCKKMLGQNLFYLGKHTAIIEQFGRYPHRNAILGRISSAEEVEFLKGPDSSF
jgi:uncharacterized protein (DUF924 family)